MRCGQVTQLDPLVPDFEDALLVNKEIIDELNNQTKKLGQAKVCLSAFGVRN